MSFHVVCCTSGVSATGHRTATVTDYGAAGCTSGVSAGGHGLARSLVLATSRCTSGVSATGHALARSLVSKWGTLHLGWVARVFQCSSGRCLQDRTFNNARARSPSLSATCRQARNSSGGP
jgi:hypothetical protein